MADLYLTAKLKTSESLENCTFLRGFFWGAQDVCGWSVLPSTVLKIGKLMRDPRDLFKGDAQSVYAAALDAICSSISVPEDYPILGAFVAMAKRLRATHAGATQRSRTSMQLFVEDHQYKLRSADAPRSVVLKFMLDRYNIDEQTVLECEALLDRVVSLPVLICHPAFERMREVDYC